MRKAQSKKVKKSKAKRKVEVEVEVEAVRVGESKRKKLTVGNDYRKKWLKFQMQGPALL